MSGSSVVNSSERHKGVPVAEHWDTGSLMNLNLCFQTRVEEHRAEIRSLNEELQRAKRIYVEQKEKEVLEKQRAKNKSAPSCSEGLKIPSNSSMRPSTKSSMRPTTSSSIRPVKSALMVGR